MNQRLNLDRFDQAVLIAIALMLLAMGGVILAGNNVGVRIESHSPQDFGNNDSTIRIRFYDEMDQASVEERFSIQPPLEGSLRWSGTRELIFEADNALISGSQYTVSVAAGAQSTNTGAVLQDDFRFDFRISQPRVVYLAPAGSQQRNLNLYDLNTGDVQQLTNAEWGIADYDVAPDGNAIAYTLYNEDGTSDIWLHDLNSGAEYQLTSCVSARCSAPAWHPNGLEIAYEREELDIAFGTAGARRIWIVTLATAQSRLLFDDTQMTGHSPIYSPSGTRISFVATNPPGIMTYNFVEGNSVFAENMQGISATFSPSGSKIIYPTLVSGAIGTQFYTQLEVISFDDQTRSTLIPTEEPIEDYAGAWRPGAENELLVTRRYLDNRYTDGFQLYLLDTETLDAEPIVLDETFTHGSASWSPDGNLITMQRFNRQEPGSRPQIWLYNMQTEALDLIAEDAFMPSFLP